VSRTEGSNPSPSATTGGLRTGTREEDVAGPEGAHRGGVGHDPVRNARFQPLLLLGGFLVLLPVLVLSAHPARGLLLAVGLAFSLAGVGAWWWVRVERRAPEQRRRVGYVLALATPPTFLTFVAVLGADRPEPFLPLGAATVCAMAPVSRAAIRLPVQAATVSIFGVMLVQAERPPTDVVLPLVLLTSIAVLASVLAHDLDRARVAERRARRDALRRAELLTAVRELPGATAAEAAVAACAAMRALGFDAAGCTIVRGGRLVDLHLDDLPAPPEPLRVGEGLAGAAVVENRTLVVGDYQADPRRLGVRRDIGSAVVASIRTGATAVGGVIGSRRERRTPTEAEVEVAEVLAAHLGAVFATDEALRRQQQLLSRMGQLERMRGSFVANVSDELRDPLTIVREVAGTLARHGLELDPQQRTDLFERMATHSEHLRRTIDALLDFSRFQSSHPEPAVERIEVVELLDPVLRGADAELSPEAAALGAQVHVDGSLVRHALTLLVAGTVGPGGSDGPTRLEVSRANGAVWVEVHAAGTAPAPPLVRSLAEQLLVAAGAELRDGAVPVLHLPLADAEAVAG
jgi:GAF domain-containing protein